MLDEYTIFTITEFLGPIDIIKFRAVNVIFNEVYINNYSKHIYGLSLDGHYRYYNVVRNIHNSSVEHGYINDKEMNVELEENVFMSTRLSIDPRARYVIDEDTNDLPTEILLYHPRRQLYFTNCLNNYSDNIPLSGHTLNTNNVLEEILVKKVIMFPDNYTCMENVERLIEGRPVNVIIDDNGYYVFTPSVGDHITLMDVHVAVYVCCFKELEPYCYELLEYGCIGESLCDMNIVSVENGRPNVILDEKTPSIH